VKPKPKPTKSIHRYAPHYNFTTNERRARAESSAETASAHAHPQYSRAGPSTPGHSLPTPRCASRPFPVLPLARLNVPHIDIQSLARLNVPESEDAMHKCMVPACDRKVADMYMLCPQHERQACDAAHGKQAPVRSHHFSLSAIRLIYPR